MKRLAALLLMFLTANALCQEGIVRAKWLALAKYVP